MKIELEIPSEVENKLREIAEESGLSENSAAEVILTNFLRGTGGRIYVGSYARGNVGDRKGFRFVVQWPFQPGYNPRNGDQYEPGSV
jgi:hypothetical protein